MRNNKMKGFTLVELLVVIAILAILATVSVVGYTSYIESTQVRVDSDLANQLNHLLEAYKVNFREDITEDNIHEVTTNLLKDGGITELNPKSSEYGYHYYYNLATGKYELLHNDVAVDDPSVLDKLIRFTLTVFGEEPENTPTFKKTAGNCFTKKYQYFLVDTAGSDIATVVGGFYTLGLDEEATLEETAAKFVDFYEAVSAIEYEAFTSMLNETVFATVNGNFVVDVNGTHTNLVVHSEATYITHIKQDLAGNVQDFRAEGKPIITVSEPTTVTVPAGVGVIEGSLYIDGDATVVLAGGSWNMIDKDFTNKSVKLGNSTYTLDASDRAKVLDASNNVVATLKANYLATAFDLALSLDNGKAVNKLNASEGYVALDNLGFTVQLTNFKNEETGKKFVGASRSDVTWNVEYITMNQEATQITDYSSYLTVDANSDDFAQKFTVVPVDGILPKLDTVVVTATMGGEPKEFLVDVVRITGLKGKLGGDSIADGVANLVCNTDSNGNPVSTNFDFVPEFTYNHDVEGLGIDIANGLFLSLTTDSHTHGPDCCTHQHDSTCDVRCNHVCDERCNEVCSHTQHDDNCCGHTHNNNCYDGFSCSHGAFGTHIDEGQTERQCYTTCSHMAEDYAHTYKCTEHYIKKQHTNECCKHYHGYHDNQCCRDKTACGGNHTDACCRYITGEKAHTHLSSTNNSYRCCIYSDIASTTNNEFPNGTWNKETCGHCKGTAHTEPTSYMDGCGTCVHTHDENCVGDPICGHPDNTAHECDECKHKVPGHDCDALKCDFRCTLEEDCLICNHDCEADGCYEKCTYTPATVNENKGVTGYGNANGELTIKVGSDGAYYTDITVDVKFYGGLDVESNDNITHLGNVNIVKVEDLFDLDDIPEGAIIAIFDGEQITSATDVFMNPSRYLLANAEDAEDLADTPDAYTFWVEKNVIVCTDGVWDDIRFYGEGNAYIAVIDSHTVDENSKLTGLRLSKDVIVDVVTGKNVRDYADFDTTQKNTTYVLLNDIAMPEGGSIIFEGGAIYGNHNTFDITKATNIGVNGIITLKNTNMQDLRVIGALYPEIAISGMDPYGANAIIALGNVTIDNCYIANTRAPLASGYEDNATHNVTLKNTILFGGRYANLELRGGAITFEGTVITINQPHTIENDVASVGLNQRAAGIGITVWFEAKTAVINGVNNLVQYNFISENYSNIPDITVDYDEYQIHEKLPISELFTEIFGNSEKYGDYYFGTDGERYMNAGIIGQDLGTLASNPAISMAVKIPSGNRIVFDALSTSHRYVQYEDTIIDGAYTVYLHMYGLINNANVADEMQDKMFEDSKNAEFIYSPWAHTVDGVVYGVYGFGNDNEIIPTDLLK